MVGRAIHATLWLDVNYTRMERLASIQESVTTIVNKWQMFSSKLSELDNLMTLVVGCCRWIDAP